MVSCGYASATEVSMNDEYVPDDTELEPIEFESPGRFALHNPDSPLPTPAAWEPAPFVPVSYTHLTLPTKA